MLLGDRLWHPNDIFKQYPEVNKIFFFHALGVRPEYRKCGIAKQLVQKGFEVGIRVIKILKKVPSAKPRTLRDFSRDTLEL